MVVEKTRLDQAAEVDWRRASATESRAGPFVLFLVAFAGLLYFLKPPLFAHFRR